MASRRPVAGEQLAQVDNPDPFAIPVWRSPVYQTPHVVIWAVTEPVTVLINELD